MLTFFKKSTPGCIFAITIILCLLWIPAFMFPRSGAEHIYNAYPMPLYELVIDLLGNNYFINTLFAILLMIANLILISFGNSNEFFFDQKSFLPALFYIIINSAYPGNQIMNPVIVATLFLNFALIRIMNSYKQPVVCSHFFDAGIIIGVGSLFYANLIWFGILIFIGMAVFRSFEIREFVSAIIGLFTPFGLTMAIYYLTDRDISSLFSNFAANLFMDEGLPFMSISSIIVYLIIGIILVLSIINLVGRVNTKKIKVRKTFTMLMWTLVISIILFVLSPAVSLDIVWIMALPCCFFLGHFFVYAKRNKLAEVLFDVILLSVFLVQLIRVVRF